MQTTLAGSGGRTRHPAGWGRLLDLLWGSCWEGSPPSLCTASQYFLQHVYALSRGSALMELHSPFTFKLSVQMLHHIAQDVYRAVLQQGSFSFCKERDIPPSPTVT
jgi:hypothetical protein